MKQRMIRTVLRDIVPDALGRCQCHEHLFIAKGKSFTINPALWMDDEAASSAEAAAYARAGGGAFVDAQPVGCGAMPEALARLSKNARVHVIASTGFHKQMFYEDGHWIKEASAQELARWFVADLAVGMAIDADNAPPSTRCAAKAGIIKCAIDERGVKPYETLFRAAAAAHETTGAPLLIHTEDGSHAVELIDLLRALGVAPRHILVCHTERSVTDFGEKLAIAQTGVYLQCDTIARFKYHSDEDEALFLKRMCEEGFEDRILLGLDTTRQRLSSYGGATGLDYILTQFYPLLQKTGVTARQIEKMCRTNPAAALSIETNI